MAVQMTTKFIAEHTGLSIETVTGLLEAGWTLVFEAGRPARWEQRPQICATSDIAPTPYFEGVPVEGAPDLHWNRRAGTIVFEPGAIIVQGGGDRDPGELAQEILDEIQNEGRPRQ